MWFLSASELSERSAAGPGIGGASTAAGASPLEHLHRSEGGQRGEPAQASHNKVVGRGLAAGLRDSWCWGVATSRECGDNEAQGRCSLAALFGCVSLSYVGFAYLIKGQQKRQFHAAYLFQSQVPQPVWLKNMEYGLLPCWTEENFQRMSYLQQGIAEALLLAHFTARLEDLPPPVQILHVEWELPLSLTQQYSPFSRAHGSSGELVPPGIVQGQFFQGVPAILGQSPSHTSLLPSSLLAHYRMHFPLLLQVCSFAPIYSPCFQYPNGEDGGLPGVANHCQAPYYHLYLFSHSQTQALYITNPIFLRPLKWFRNAS